MDRTQRPPTAAELAKAALEKADQALKANDALTIRMNLETKRMTNMEQRLLKAQEGQQESLARIAAQVDVLAAYKAEDMAEREARKKEIDARQAQEAARSATTTRRIGILLPVSGAILLFAISTFVSNLQAVDKRYLVPGAVVAIAVCIGLLIVALYYAGRGGPGAKSLDH